REYDIRALTVVAAVSAQDARGVHALHAQPAAIVRAQLDAVPWERVAAIRVGALASADAVFAVAEALAEYARILAVVDPVWSASLGGALADDAAIDKLRDRIAPLPNVILTPNLVEAARLLGIERVERGDMRRAAEQLRARGAFAVLLKGGHLDGEPTDILAHADGTATFADTRLPNEMRATGCTLAMALACELARGVPLLDAVVSARAFVRAKIAANHHFAGVRAAY
ncbi:MAG: bifunctional hydroxymethylpyrimidine kinase/phosphomethylpyrimidine kinase, partial [Vulcanimicrobiaceae bacterium]